MPASTTSQLFAQLKLLHGEPGLVDRTTSSNFGTKQICATTSTVSPFVVARNPNIVTAANVSVSGRVMTPDGAGLRNARVSIRDPQGHEITALTGSFGYFSFDSVESGANYVVSVTAKRYSFQSQLIQLTDSITDLSFTPQ
jgi:hypothetical protein